MSLHNESIRKEVLELFLEQVCDIINSTPYKTDVESIHLLPSCFIGFKKAPDLLWTRELQNTGEIGKALNSVLNKLKNWHLSNLNPYKHGGGVIHHKMTLPGCYSVKKFSEPRMCF